ncbi:hypothetical protein [Sphingomonas sp. Root241]|uniref:hypothetical protein n=1 Tax=Sphingomonas sp. Root241 TaxID=1736501 RepID=UPI0006F42262|nr:hypothetical protein [Sphingomonas sp. Root241]KRC79997.1 hypothetical protein ASE13_13210 [Sphingomonas sp. Root241]
MRGASVLALALALAPLPAAADVTATYSVGKSQLTVEVDDSGDYRAEIPGKFALLRHGGDEFILITHNGKVSATRSDIFFALLKTKAPKNAPTGGPMATMRFVTTQGKDEVVAGRRGSNWQIAPEGQEPATLAMVVSADAQLAPVGGVFHRGIARALDGFAPFFGNNMGFRDQIVAVLAKGTVLRLAGPENIVLQNVSGDEIDAGRFAAPAELLDSEAFDAALDEPTQPPAKP